MILVKYSTVIHTYDLGGDASVSNLDSMADAIAGMRRRRYSLKQQWHHQLHVELYIVDQYTSILAWSYIRPRWCFVFKVGFDG